MVRPKRLSSVFEKPIAPVTNEGVSSSLCQVKGSACQAMSPRAMACSMRLRVRRSRPVPGIRKAARSRWSTHSVPRLSGGGCCESLDGVRIMLVEILPHHRRLRVDETDVEMAFEHHEDALHFRIGCRFADLRQPFSGSAFSGAACSSAMLPLAPTRFETNRRRFISLIYRGRGSEIRQPRDGEALSLG